MDTIVPDQSTEEGAKVATYQPGDTVQLVFTVSANTGGELQGEITECELIGGEDEMYEEEVPAEPAATSTVPKAVVAVAGKRTV